MRNEKISRAFTLIELMVAVSLLVIIMAAIVPQFSAIRSSWANTEESSTIVQNAMVLSEHINRNLSTATKIIAVSSSTQTNGFITFKDNLGAEKKYILSGGYVAFGNPGSEQQLAGPVSEFKVSCFSLDNFETPITDANNIRYVEIETDLTNKIFTTSVYLQINAAQSCGLIGYWKFDETSGTTAADSSGSGNNGNLINGPLWTTGQIGGAVDLDGWNDYINCGNAQSLNVTGDISIAFWLNADSLSNEPDLVTKGLYTESYSVWAASTGTIKFAINNDRLSSISEIQTGQWYHIAVTRCGSTRKIYINGRLDASDTYSQAIGNTSRALTIASEGYHLNGKIDDVRIYDHALSDAEVAQLANTLRYQGFNEAKTSSDAASLTIPIPTDTSENDLLIAAIATDGDSSTSIAAPVGQGWTLIQKDTYNNAVTLSVWRKIADSSESANHTFTWTGNRQAYGWIMRFTGYNTNNPINAFSSAGQSSITPISPAVTTTVGDCLILRLGAFDEGAITIDEPGLLNHTPITMDKAESILFEDSFETNFNKWTDNGVTNWDRTGNQHYFGSWSAHADKNNDLLTSDNINTSSYNSFTVEFWYKNNNLDTSDNVSLQFYNGSGYTTYLNLSDSTENIWNYFSTALTAAQYRRANFRVRYNTSGIHNNNRDLWIDDVKVRAGGVSAGAGYVKQSAIGNSETSTFSLGASNEAVMITIAIAPPSNDIDCEGQIEP